jgi:hypothetical protein
MIRKALAPARPATSPTWSAASSMREATWGEEANMTSVEPTENEELSGRVLGIIGAYGMGDCNPREPYLKTTPTAAPPEIVPVRGVRNQQPRAAPAT